MITQPAGENLCRLIVLNFNDEEPAVRVGGEYKNFLTGEDVNGDLLLPVCGYAVLYEK